MSNLITHIYESTRRSWAWWRHERKIKKLTRTHPLRILAYEVTRRCNLECAYCGSDCTIDRRADELSSQEWIEITRQLADDFDPRYVFVSVIGGEPLIKEGILDILGELNRMKFPWGMVTNGFMITRQMAERLVSAGMRSIALSMDAPPEQNDAIRGRGASENVVSAVKNLRSAGYQGLMEIMSTITTPVIPYLAEFKNFIAALGITRWRLSPVMPIGRARERPDLVPGARGVRTILEFIRSSRLDSSLLKPEFCEECFVGNRFEGMVRPYLAQCLAGICVGGIQADGRIGACPELGEAFTQGDIRKERFRDVWNKKYQIFRDRSWTKKDECAVCKHWTHCKGSGIHLYDTPDSKLMRCLYKMAKEAEGGR